MCAHTCCQTHSVTYLLTYTQTHPHTHTEIPHTHVHTPSHYFTSLLTYSHMEQFTLTHRHTHTQRDIHTHRDTHIHTHRDTHTHRHSHTYSAKIEAKSFKQLYEILIWRLSSEALSILNKVRRLLTVCIQLLTLCKRLLTLCVKMYLYMHYYLLLYDWRGINLRREKASSQMLTNGEVNGKHSGGNKKRQIIYILSNPGNCSSSVCL